MPERVFSLDAQPPPPGPDEARRARRARRYSTCLIGLCQAVGDQPDAFWRPRVCDLSALGVGLLFTEPLALRTLLEIDVESASGRRVRLPLARVVHVEQGEDDWVVGCAFTAELGEADLKVFRAERLRPPLGDSRRWVRFPCNVETVCHTSGPGPGGRSPARVLNVSADGVGLLLACPFEPGTLLEFDFPGARGGPARKMRARVARLVEHSPADWFHGCAFAEQLSQDVLFSLLDEHDPFGPVGY